MTTDRAVVIRMPADLHDAVKRTAASEGRSMASMMRSALRKYASDDNPKDAET